MIAVTKNGLNDHTLDNYSVITQYDGATLCNEHCT